jgi:hypothetical protein
MSYRFTLAAVTAAITLTGCAKQQKPGAPEDFFNGPTQINVSHVVTRADDGSAIFLTVDGNDAGPLVAGKNTELHIPAGKHKVGGYAQTLLGLGRVTIQSVDVTTKPGEVTQLAYSVTRDKPVFAKEGVTKLPPKPVAAPAAAPAEQAAPAQTDQTAATATSATIPTVAATPPAAVPVTTGTQATQSTTAATTTPAATVQSTSTPATATESTTTPAPASQSSAATPAATSTDTTQSTTATAPATTSTTTTQNAATTSQPATTTTTTTTQSATESSAKPATTTTETSKSQHNLPPATRKTRKALAAQPPRQSRPLSPLLTDNSVTVSVLFIRQGSLKAMAFSTHPFSDLFELVAPAQRGRDMFQNRLHHMRTIVDAQLVRDGQQQRIRFRNRLIFR